jgi:Tfp pilus assembly protein PilV
MDDAPEQGPKGDKGDKGEPGEAVLVPLAQEMVRQLVDGAKWSTESIHTLSKTIGTLRKVILALVILFVAVGAIAGYLLNENITHPLSSKLQDQIVATQQVTNTLRAQNITNCENNNKFRSAQVATWEKNFALQSSEGKSTAALEQQLIVTLTQGDPTRIAEVKAILVQSSKASAAETSDFLAFVKSVDAPKDCQALYANPTP